MTGSDNFFLGAAAKDKASDRQSSKEALLKRAAGRVFVRVGRDFVEQGLPADWKKQAVAVAAFSPEYFELLKQRPKVAAILALGDRVVFRDGKRIVHIRPAQPKTAPKPPAPGKPAVSRPVKAGR